MSKDTRTELWDWIRQKEPQWLPSDDRGGIHVFAFAFTVEQRETLLAALNPLAPRPEVDAPDKIKEAAEIAGRCWHAFSQTKQAHERHYPGFFRPEEYGLDYDKAVYSRDCMERILGLLEPQSSEDR